jgi:hypothetical protein
MNASNKKSALVVSTLVASTLVTLLASPIAARAGELVALANANAQDDATASTPKQTAERNQGVVVGVHNEGSTDAFLGALHLPRKGTDGGRFAVVQLINAAYGEASYALVFVPRHLAVKKNDVVEMAPTALNLLANPGKGVVLKVDHDLVSCK